MRYRKRTRTKSRRSYGHSKRKGKKIKFIKIARGGTRL